MTCPSHNEALLYLSNKEFLLQKSARDNPCLKLAFMKKKKTVMNQTLRNRG